MQDVVELLSGICLAEEEFNVAFVDIDELELNGFRLVSGRQ